MASLPFTNLSMVHSIPQNKSMQNRQNSWAQFSLLQWAVPPMRMLVQEAVEVIVSLHGMTRTKERTLGVDGIVIAYARVSINNDEWSFPNWE